MKRNEEIIQSGECDELHIVKKLYEYEDLSDYSETLNSLSSRCF